VFKELDIEIKRKAVERLKHENREKDAELLDENSYFFGKPEEYGIKLYAFYECFKCKQFYYGGQHNCEHEMQEMENAEEQKEELKKEELICSVCTNSNCPKHGVDFINWKCRFCCAGAIWHCFGTTHFCEPCHNTWQAQQQNAKDGKLIQCTPETCKLKNNHPPHGDEFPMGCAECE